MNLLDLLSTKTVMAQLIALVFAALAAFHVVLPVSADQPAIVGAVLLVLATATTIARFGHPGSIAVDAKAWYLSKIIWTQIVAALFAVMAIVGAVPADVDQGGVVAGIMAIVAIVNIVLRKQTTAAIA